MGISFEEYNISREYKKLHCTVKQMLLKSTMIFNNAEEDETLTIIKDTLKVLKDLTRGQECNKMCIIQDLLGGCNKCEHINYCTTGYGKAIR